MQQSVEQPQLEEGGRTTKQQHQHHPAWLQYEINKAQQRKQQTDQYTAQQQHKHQRVTLQANQTRDRIRNTQQPTPPTQQPHSISFIDNHRPATCTTHGRPQSGRGEKSRPKWAMTAAEEEKEMETECYELVGFVAELDYEQWMGEMEERGAKRAEEEKENGQEEGGQQDNAVIAETLGNESHQETGSEWDDSLPRPPTGLRPATQSSPPRPHTATSRPHTARPATSPPAATDNTETLVAALLHSSTAIRNIHSSHSLRALISATHSGRIQQHSTAAVVPANSVSVAIPAPLVSVVATRDTVYGKINPSQLPYLHRHPAV